MQLFYLAVIPYFVVEPSKKSFCSKHRSFVQQEVNSTTPNSIQALQDCYFRLKREQHREFFYCLPGNYKHKLLVDSGLLFKLHQAQIIGRCLHSINWD